MFDFLMFDNHGNLHLQLDGLPRAFYTDVSDKIVTITTSGSMFLLPRVPHISI